MAVVCIVCAVMIVAMVVCFLMARVLWKVGAREVVLEADLVQQKEALQQTERKSMNKSNAFVRASHDIRSSLAAVAELIEISPGRRPSARPTSSITSTRWMSAPISSSVSPQPWPYLPSIHIIPMYRTI